MINITEDIQSLTDFKKHTIQFISDLKKSGRPTVLTVNGKAEIVVMDATAFQRMQERFEMEESVAEVRRSLQDFEAHKFSSADKVFGDLRKRITQPQKKVIKPKRK